MFVIRCAVCSAEMGTLEAPSKESLAEAAADSPFSGLIGLLPDNVTETVAALCTMRCRLHSRPVEDNGEQETRQAEDDALDAEIREREERERHSRSAFGH